MANPSRRLARQGSWSALAALVVASVAAPVQQAPVGVQSSLRVGVPAISHAAAPLKPSSGTTQDIVHRTPWP